MKVEQLEYFLEIAELKSIHKAADKLYLSPQNLSNIIRALEREMDETLFIRNNKGVELSNAGLRFLPYAEKMVGVYHEYMSSKNYHSRFINVFTTPAIEKEIATLHEYGSFDDYYLTIRKKSPADLLTLMSKKTPGIFLLCGPERGMERFRKLENYSRLTVVRETYNICSAEKLQTVKKMDEEGSDSGILFLSSEAYDESDSSQYLYDSFQYVRERNKSVIENYRYSTQNYAVQIGDIALCKRILREQPAVFGCISLFYRNNFPEEGEWSIFKKEEIQPIEFGVVFHLDWSAEDRQRFMCRLQKVFQIEDEEI